MSLFRPNPNRNNRVVPRVEALEARRLCTFFIPSLPTPKRTGGASALVGSVLVVVTNRPGANETTIQDDGGGNVTVEWNGHTPPTFHGVSRIVLDGRGRQNVFNFRLTNNVTVPHEVDALLDGTNSSFIQDLGGFQSSGLSFQTQTAPAPHNLAKGQKSGSPRVGAAACSVVG
jgi:hypothetical protein